LRVYEKILSELGFMRHLLPMVDELGCSRTSGGARPERYKPDDCGASIIASYT
jgi:hypothetical protein